MYIYCNNIMIFQSRSLMQMVFRSKAPELTVPKLCSSIRFCLDAYTRPFSSRALCRDEEEAMLKEILATSDDTPRPASELCAAHIKDLCGAGNLSSAARLLRSLHANQFPHSANAINVLLAAATQKNDVELVSLVFINVIESSSVSPLPLSTYLGLAKAFAKIKDCTRLLKLIEDITELTSPSTKILNRILFAFGECRQIDQALVIFDHIKRLNRKPDLTTHNIVLQILGQAGRINEMLREFAVMKETGIFPDIVSYNTLLNGLRKRRRVELCAVFYKEMVDDGICPDLLTYTTMIVSFGRSGNVEQAVKLFEEMKSKHMCPSVCIYRSLIKNLKKMGNLELATKLSEEMKLCTDSDLARPTDVKAD